MSGLLATVHRDLVADVILVRVSGELGLATVPGMRGTLLKCVAECPTAVIVDLSRCGYASPSMLTVFLAAAQVVRPQPAVAILLCHPGPELHGVAERAALGTVLTYPTVDAARAAVATARTLVRRSVRRLAGTVAAPGLARELVRDTCDRWDIGHVRPPAELVVSELVTNGVTHAGTDVELDLALRKDFLHIRVRDESTVQPVPRTVPTDPDPVVGGRGLNLVGLYSEAWGYVVGGAGKIVWATLRVQPIGTPTPR